MTLSIKDKWALKQWNYTGLFIIIKHQNQYLIINQVPMEAYLAGVLMGEISPQWPQEAIRAQAIAARSYAYHLIQKNKNQPYHLVSTDKAQVFHGTHSIHEALRQNILHTKHILLTSKRGPIISFFHASCGGKTARPNEVWHPNQKSPPYFQNIRCHYCKSHPSYDWEFTLSSVQLEKQLQKHLKPNETIKRMRVLKRSASKRITSIEIRTSTKRQFNLSGNQFRRLISPRALKSLNFKMKVVSFPSKKKSSSVINEDKGISFSGRGYGHGVGLCQWGAKNHG